MSDSLRPYELQHTRLPCPSLSPGVCFTHVHWVRDAMEPSQSCVTPFSSCSRSFPASSSFPISQFFTSVGYSIEALASASVLPMSIQGWFPLDLTGLISLLSEELWRVFSSTTIQKHQSFCPQPSLWFSFHICTWCEKSYWRNHSFDCMNFLAKWYLSFLTDCLDLS